MKKYKRIAFIILSTLTLQSCSTITLDPADCSNINSELNIRYSLFKKLDKNEINKRKSIKVPTFSGLDDLGVTSAIVRSIQSVKENAKLIPVDLRHYQNVSLGNIVVSNINNDFLLGLFLQNSKFSQGFFSLININSKNITIIPPSTNKALFKKTIIRRGDLNGAEIVINVSNSNNIDANMKFSEGQEISIIADNITVPYRLDLREASNLQLYRNNKWIMPVYSIVGNKIKGGKDTSGLFKIVNNKKVEKIELHKFKKSKVQCYTDPLGLKFK